MSSTMRLSALYQQLTPEQREELAKKVDTSVAYLYQLATRWQGKKPSLKLMTALARADSRLTLADMAEEFDEPPKQKPATEPEPNGA
jgi:hypothetical protein